MIGYKQLSDADVKALVAYVRSLKSNAVIFSAYFSSCCSHGPVSRLADVRATLAGPTTGRWLQIANA